MSPLGATRRVACAGPDYLRRWGVPQMPEDLARQLCIQFTGLTPGSEWELEVAGNSVKVPVLSTNQMDAVLDACVKGLVCGMLLGYQISGFLAAAL